jgi:hypothetical protein
MADRWVTIATFHDPVAASLAKNFLASEEIPVALFDESTVAVAWQLAGAIGGIKLQVPAIHVERAELLLAQIQEEKLAEEEAEPLPATGFASPETVEELQAEAEDKQPINVLVDRVYRSAVFGLIFWPLQAYVLWLLLQVATMPGKVSPNRRWKVWVSVLLNVPLLLVLLLILSWVYSAIRGGAAVPNARWAWQQGPEGRFQIRMPGKAAPHSHQLQSSFGVLRFDGIRSDWEIDGFWATLCDCPAAARQAKPKEVLEEITKLQVFDQRERLLRKDEFTMDEMNGMEYEIESVGANRRGKIFLRRGTLLVLEIYGPPHWLRSEEAEHFFQSMRWR